MDDEGVPRFKRNEIVRFLLDTSPISQNVLRDMKQFSEEDWSQLAQLMGYSVGGYADCSFADRQVVREAEEDAEILKSGGEPIEAPMSKDYWNGYEDGLDRAMVVCRDAKNYDAQSLIEELPRRPSVDASLFNEFLSPSESSRADELDGPYVLAYIDTTLTPTERAAFLNLKFKEGWEYVTGLSGPVEWHGGTGKLPLYFRRRQ